MNLKQIITASLIGVSVIAVIALKPFTIVSQGEVKVPSLFGEVQETYLDEGLHMTNPFYSFDRYDVKENAFSIENVSIPSQDKFKSFADVTIMWSVEASSTPKLRKTIGTMTDVETKLLRQPLLALLREAGRSVEKAQDLYKADVQAQLQDEVKDGLSVIASEYGLNIHAVYIQDITLPDVIQKAIVVTKELEEREAQEKARLAQETLVYARDTAKAEAAAKSALHNKTARQAAADALLYERKQATDAQAYDVKQQADAKLYAAQAEAKGNKALAASLTPALLESRRIEVDMQRMKSWNGSVPTTLMGGETANAVPLYHMGK
ncbi:TPA: hypothetical protein N2902_000207 [Vibrio parahaemolyticus]|uniref:SPFH domain-containing protein n=1 Tax=Vibrio parahaemolyticus TaxID=670 RepID=A0AA47JLP9_VIBPH|nr:SPFH domain-containing protein [Vibrio parahaemolyticus]EJL6791928.1 hypothetical protein [Vibrio alginolyticus]HDY7614458.1 hypothetical protein [Vibrio vulnificus]EGR1951270.1 hypothetical protein [Vibrio parahaemolyticus]EGR3328505.1 hypothetical protein [Vibrio parahaemolyticus]EGR9044547.1 hypothetical protein [Vibrio parahaemolyticus]